MNVRAPLCCIGYHFREVTKMVYTATSTMFSLRNAVSDTDFAPQGRESGVTVLRSTVNFTIFGI